MSDGSSIAPPITPTDTHPGNGLQNVTITTPAWFFLQAFSQSSLALPQTADDFTSRYGSFPGANVDELVSYFQALNNLAGQFGNPNYYFSQGSGFLSNPTGPSDIMGSTFYALGAINNSVFSAAANIGSNLAPALSANLEAGTSDNPGVNQQTVYNFLNGGSSTLGVPSLMESTSGAATLTNNAITALNSFGQNFASCANQFPGMATMIDSMLTYAGSLESVDAALIAQLTTDAAALLKKYNEEMAVVDWTRNPGSVLPDIALFGPFGGGILFGISAIVGNLIAKDAQNVLSEWNAFEAQIQSLETADAQKALFLRDFSNFNTSITLAALSIPDLQANLASIYSTFSFTLGQNFLATIETLNPVYFKDYDSINNLLDLTTAISEWPTVQDMTGNFFLTCLPPSPPQS